MKILQIIYSLASGGAERFVVDLSNALTEMGHEVCLCSLRDDRIHNNGFYKTEINDRVNYVNLKLPIGFHLSNITAIYQVIRQMKSEVVHCHQNLVNYIFPLAIVFPKVKFFYTIHTDAPKEVGSRLEYWLRRIYFTSQKVNAITISNETSKSFSKYYKTRNYTEIYNGRKKPTASDEFEKVKEYIQQIRNGNIIVFLHIGRCMPPKNQKMLINVFNRLIREGQPIALIIIGNGFDSKLGEELKSSASDNIFFIGQKQNISDYFFNVDAFCLSSIHEGMPITLIESLACGCIPICTPVGGISDTIKERINGFLSKSTSEDDYYQAIISFINHGDGIIKNDLIDYYNTHFSIEKCAHKHLNTYLGK